MPHRNDEAQNSFRPDENLKQVSLDGPLAQKHKVHFIGKGKDVIVLSHGFGTDQTVWRQVAKYLSDCHTIMVFDMPGAGPLLPDDFDPDRYRSIAAFADDLLDLLDELDIERCRYVGHSVSGMIGALAAIEAPARFEQLFLLNASPCYLNDQDYIGGFEQKNLEDLFAAMSANYQAWVSGFAPLAASTEVPATIQEFSASLMKMRPDVAIRIARTIFESDVRNLLPLVTTPTVLLHSKNDIVVPEAVARYLQRSIKNSEIVWLNAQGHFPHISAPGEIATILKQYLA